jgi:UDP-glucose:O-linked fucose beta-1,3-glucosyltransferase
VTLTEKEALEKLIDVMKKRDEEAFCLMRYTRQDDIRIKVKNKKKRIRTFLFVDSKELTTELERYSEKSIQYKRATEEEIIEYSSREIELDKIADQFRRSHQQRQQLIKRWETILEQMQRKDYDIDTLAMVYPSNLINSSEISLGISSNQNKSTYERTRIK